MTLAADARHSGKPYLLLGSSTGTKPGINFSGGLVFPLNFDWYTSFTLGAPNTLVVQSFPTLDESASGTAVLALPSGLPPSLASTTLHHAYLIMDPVRVAADTASNAIPVTLVN